MVLSIISLMVSWPVYAKEIQTAQRLIILDPGHGGKDQGIQVPSEKSENSICLNLAQITAAALDSTYNVMLTRSKDEALSPDKRISFANQKKADLYISIHLARAGTSYGGFYYFSLPDNGTKIEPDTDHWQTIALTHATESKRAAQIFQDIYAEKGPKLNYFYASIPSVLLEGTKMPAILIEPFPAATLSLDLDKRNAFLSTQAQLIKQSVDAFFKTLPTQ